ncbi:MAG: exodeoxyribonuclease VII large subunit [bacterium]|nr:exodeoxyribonuclease VII large subunit [bacterium]
MASVYSVSQVNGYIKNLFTQDFALQRISIRGEVSNCKYHTSGHIYFTLKDKTGTLAAVMFASQRRGLTFSLAEGQQVVATGNVNVYERDGRYQLYVNQIELDGAGDLFRRFQALKASLEEMGMFAPEYKQPIPKFALTVGVVTAPTGAAIRDIINITHRRNPYVQLYLYPALVQGSGAAPSIVRGIETLDRMDLDVLIVGRGGGSIEDLWAFNEEMVARAIFACQTPVISAVGHETDFTIADFVADLRAPTPSAAAELAVFEYAKFQAELSGFSQRLWREMASRLQEDRARLRQLELKLQVLHPRQQLQQQRQYLAELEGRLQTLLSQRMQKERHRLELLAGRLQGLSPLLKISKGFAFVSKESGEKLESVTEAKVGDRLILHVEDGRIKARVEECVPEERMGKRTE